VPAAVIASKKKRQQITAYRPTAAEVERSERQGDLIAMYRAELLAAGNQLGA